VKKTSRKSANRVPIYKDGTIKIAKFLADCGIASRRKSEQIVENGTVSVNGERMTNVAMRINPKTDVVKIRERFITPQKSVYYLLNKPTGVTSTTLDSHAEKLITELVPNIPPVWPVGRLDKETSGLIIMTNDGDLTQRLTHPKFEVEKEYLAVVNSPLSEQDLKIIRKGIRLEDGFIKPDEFQPLDDNTYRIIIHSGKKRVVRRIFERLGKRVLELKRVRIDFLTLETLQPGNWRNLTSSEVKRLYGR
jgi:23S rRNA pseudouridine2605 synthase